MRRIAVVLSILALAACGGRETESTATQKATPPVGTRSEPAAPAAPAPTAQAPAPTTQAPAEPMGMASPQSQRCLDLVAAGEYTQALPICTAAYAQNPSDPGVQAALERARAEAAKTAAAGAAAQSAAGEAAAGAMGAAEGAQKAAEGAAEGAVGSAAGAAKGAVDEAAKGATGKLGQ